MTKIKEIKNYLNFLKKQPSGFLYKDDEKTKVNKEKNKKLLEKIYTKYKNCQECPLSQQGRTQIVFGHGNTNAQLMLIGEGPGKDEDIQGIPFIGRAGKLLTKIIEAMELKREDIYISNVVKCRPPNNRLPLPQESETCKKLILFKEIEIIKPKIICTLGSCATQALLGKSIKITKARGMAFNFNGYTVIPTFHPAYLLRNPNAKKNVWEDMKKILKNLKKNSK
ncbi:uracil-DNA glycosylase [Candidatus Dependentiae bacterium]